MKIELENYLAKSSPETTLAQHTKDVEQQADILYRLGYIEKHTYKNLRIATHYHDYGKINKFFQKRIKQDDDTYKKFDPETEVYHNILSVYFIPKSDFQDEIEAYYCVLYAVLNHHYYIESNLGYILDSEKNNERIISNLSEYQREKLSGRTLQKVTEKAAKIEWKRVKGLLYRCDYSASANIPVEYQANFLIKKLEDMVKGWKKKNKNAELNELQQYCQKYENENMIITAQTGMGKTEAGLIWIGDNKGFFVLPLKAAINAIYDRIKDKIINEEKIEERLALLHSDTISEYQRQAKDSSKEFDFLDYYSKSKQLSLPLNITTLDQVFKFVYKYPGYELLLATLGYSKIVIDEIQMYDADLLAYLIYGLELICVYGGKFAILTATLAPFVKELLKIAVGTGGVSWKEACFIDDLERHSLKINQIQLTAEDIWLFYQSNRAKEISNKILIVCNTITKAQAIYEELVSYAQNEVMIHLLHSKFIKKDRKCKEDAILECGKTYIENSKLMNEKNEIWIATQIVEASLDIDFDYLFTELSDINGLFQRLGRCNRKGVKSISNYNCFVYTQINNKILKEAVGGRGFIDGFMHRLSHEALIDWKGVGVDGILSEKEKMEIIDTYFTMEKLKASPYIKNYKQTYGYLRDLFAGEKSIEDVKKCFRNIDTYTAIPKTIYDENKREIEKQIAIIQNIEQTYAKKIQAKDELISWTLQVYEYEKKYNVVKEIEISKYEKILVVKGQYSKEVGFVRDIPQKLKLANEEPFAMF